MVWYIGTRHSDRLSVSTVQAAVAAVGHWRAKKGNMCRDDKGNEMKEDKEGCRSCESTGIQTMQSSIYEIASQWHANSQSFQRFAAPIDIEAQPLAQHFAATSTCGICRTHLCVTRHMDRNPIKLSLSLSLLSCFLPHDDDEKIPHILYLQTKLLYCMSGTYLIIYFSFSFLKYRVGGREGGVGNSSCFVIWENMNICAHKARIFLRDLIGRFQKKAASRFFVLYHSIYTRIENSPVFSFLAVAAAVLNKSLAREERLMAQREMNTAWASHEPYQSVLAPISYLLILLRSQHYRKIYFGHFVHLIDKKKGRIEIDSQKWTWRKVVADAITKKKKKRKVGEGNRKKKPPSSSPSLFSFLFFYSFSIIQL